MICERIIREALAQDPLETAKAKVQTRKVGQIIRERYEALHGGALRRVRDCVPTEHSSNPAGHRVAS